MDVLEKPLLVLNTIEKGDVGISRGSLSIPLAPPIRLSDINSIEVIKSRAEQSKVYTLDLSSLTIITGETYKIQVRAERVGNQGWDRPNREYYVVAMTDVSDQAAAKLDIYTKLAERINQDIEIPITAAVVGSTLVITDRPGYFLKGSGGESNIRVINNSKGIGFAEGNLVVTKNAVYGTGIGSELVKKQVLIDPIIGNAYNSRPYYAALSQVESSSNYTSIVINSVVSGNGINMLAESLVMKWVTQIILVKEGTTGYNDLMKYLTEASISRNIKDQPSMAASGLYPVEPIGTLTLVDKSTSKVRIGGSIVDTTTLGTATLNPLALDPAKGYYLATDIAAGEGRELSTASGTDEPGFIVGKGAFSLSAVVNLAVLANGKINVGFRKKGAANAAAVAYDDVALIGNTVGGADISTVGNIAGAGAETTATGKSMTAATDAQFDVVVLSDGSVKAFFNGEEFPVLSDTGVAMKFPKGTELKAFIHFVTVAAADAEAYVKRFEAFPFDQGKTKGGILRT